MARFDRIGTAIATLRERAGLSQRDLAGHAGITPAMLSNYETGAKEPSLHSLGRILDALGAGLGSVDDALDLVNGRPPRRTATDEARGEAVAGLDLALFLGVESEELPPRVSPAFTEMIRAFRQVARVLYRSEGGGAPAPPFAHPDERPPDA
jgi:transcriptional regulator with XRE-family HTH domain